MILCSFDTSKGTIKYWKNQMIEGRKTLVFLPGLSASHKLFDKQIEFFRDRYNLLVWDAPGHSLSRPFNLDFSLEDKARWLHEILEKENIGKPILIGQSMGGYVSQVYLEIFPGQAEAFISIDSAPLQRHYMTKSELWILKRTESMYRLYPWKLLLKDGARGCAETEYGIRLMKEMMEEYGNDPRYYCHLVGQGYKMVAEAIERDLKYEITCPALLICGEKDKAGYTKKYNERWAKEEGLPIRWIKDAGHNSNTDKPEEINEIIEEVIKNL